MNKEITLTIDSTAKIWSVSLFANKLELGTIIGTDETPLSKHLVSKIFELLLKYEIKLSEISLIGVCTGPGSFTGLRVGLSTAKGLAQSINCAVVGIPILDILAYSVPLEIKVVSLITTNQKQVYYQEFEPFMIKKDGSKILTIEEFFQPDKLIENYKIITNLNSYKVLKEQLTENYLLRIEVMSDVLSRYLAQLISEPGFEISEKFISAIYL